MSTCIPEQRALCMGMWMFLIWNMYSVYDCSLWSETFCTALLHSTCGKLFEEFKFSSGSIVWKLSTRTITVVRAFSTFSVLSAERDSQHLAGEDIKVEPERERGVEEKQRQKRRDKWKRCGVNEKVWDRENESIQMKGRVKQNERVKEMMTIHHCRYSQCIIRGHEWLLSMSERCRLDPSIPSDCASREWWLLPGCSGGYAGLRDGDG